MNADNSCELKPIEKGISKKEVKDWNEFRDLIFNALCHEKEKATKEKPYINDYVWRGQRCESRKLISSFDRDWRKKQQKATLKSRDEFLKQHLDSFVYACRGKLAEFGISIRELKRDMRGKVLNRNHIWALAQHYGLKTPLLDWCYSPFVAAFFAFKDRDDNHKENRVIYGLNYKDAFDGNTTLELLTRNYSFAYFDPMSSEHPRLINQRGLFTITKNGEDIEEIVKKNWKERTEPWIVKILIPNNNNNRENRVEFLRALNLMNINHMTLFPEIYGAAKFCNIGIEDGLDDYAVFHGQDV